MAEVHEKGPLRAGERPCQTPRLQGLGRGPLMSSTAGKVSGACRLWSQGVSSQELKMQITDLDLEMDSMLPA